MVLSRTNLLALLHKLEMPNSARTIVKSFDDLFLVVKSEPDEDHYFGGPVRGVMHPATEDFIKSRG